MRLEHVSLGEVRRVDGVAVAADGRVAWHLCAFDGRTWARIPGGMTGDVAEATTLASESAADTFPAVPYQWVGVITGDELRGRYGDRRRFERG